MTEVERRAGETDGHYEWRKGKLREHTLERDRLLRRIADIRAERKRLEDEIIAEMEADFA